jgi:phytoene dehydrogenase-like protein
MSGISGPSAPQTSYGDLTSADVVVVGAGIGGLTCAAYLAQMGKRVIVVDRHSLAGGNATVFEHDGYEFDVGVHYLGDCEPGGAFSSMLDPLGIEIEWNEIDPDGFDIYHFPDGMTFKVPRDIELFRQRLLDVFADEKECIDAYVETIREIDAELTAGKAPNLLLQHMDSTLGGFLADFEPSPRLRTLLAANHGVYAAPPDDSSLVMHAVVAMHYFKGAFYPKGGGQVIADQLCETIRAHGGDIVLRTAVERIIIEDGRATGVELHAPSPERAKGVPDRIDAPIVVSNADLKRTVFDLVGREHFPTDFVERVEGYAMALPIFVVYLVLDRDLAAEGFSSGNHFYCESDDIEGAYADLEAGTLGDQAMVFITLSSLKDPSNTRLCRPGQTNLQVMTLAPRDHSFWGVEGGPVAGEHYRKNAGYLARKQELRDAAIAAAAEVIPGLEESIVYEETATPITHERYTRSTGGTSYGIRCTQDQVLMRRPSFGTPIGGFFIVGASTMTGHGIAGTMSGGVACATAVSNVDVPSEVAGGYAKTIEASAAP